MPRKPNRSLAGSKAGRRKVRLDQRLLELGLAPDLKLAQAYILEGKVLVGEQRIDKCGFQVRAGESVRLRLKRGRYVSRGGLKLEAALQRFALPVAGKVVLDAGASTGGFTDCLVQHGARLVYAVDAGYGQLKARLTHHPAVRNLERTNLGQLNREQLQPPIDLCTADLSYLSLQSAVPQLRGLFLSPPRMICLVKPLFEGLEQSRPAEREAIANVLAELFGSLQRITRITRVSVSPICGSKGTVEFLILIDEAAPQKPPAEKLVSLAMADWQQNPPEAIQGAG